MENNRPGAVPMPAEALSAELDDRGWTASCIAGMINVPVDLIEAILVGTGTIDARVANLLGSVLGTGADYWLDLEATSPRLPSKAGETGQPSPA